MILSGEDVTTGPLNLRKGFGSMALVPVSQSKVLCNSLNLKKKKKKSRQEDTFQSFPFPEGRVSK